MNERTMLRFLKLIACENGKIGTYAKLMDDRNETGGGIGSGLYSCRHPYLGSYLDRNG